MTKVLADKLIQPFKITRLMVMSVNSIFRFLVNWRKFIPSNESTPVISMLKHNKTNPLLKHVVTGNEKWIVYNKHKRSWAKWDEATQTTSKVDIYQRRVMLSVWWDNKSIFYFGILSKNQTINFLVNPIDSTFLF